jgi:hypothetical protein
VHGCDSIRYIAQDTGVAGISLNSTMCAGKVYSHHCWLYRGYRVASCILFYHWLRRTDYHAHTPPPPYPLIPYSMRGMTLINSPSLSYMIPDLSV